MKNPAVREMLANATGNQNKFAKRAIVATSEDLFSRALTSKPQSKVLKNALSSRLGNWVDSWSAHHIIPAEHWNRKIIRDLGLNLDSASNGIGLGRIHRCSHPAYSNAVKKILIEVENAMSRNRFSVEQMRGRLIVAIDKLKLKLAEGEKIHIKDNAGAVTNWNRIVEEITGEW